MSDVLKIDMQGQLAVLTMNRPARRNMIDDELCAALTNFFLSSNTDNNVRAIVLTGEGKDFCIGADITAKPDTAGGAKSTLDYRFGVVPYMNLFKTYWEVEKPVISAVNGTVAGIGWMTALLADLVVAAEGSRWTHVFTRRGMMPHALDPYFLPRIIPFHRLNEIALLSDQLTAETLAGWGLLNRVVPKDKVLSTAIELGQRLAAGPTKTLGFTKKAYRRSLEANLADMWREDMNNIALLSTTEDRVEGVQAMRENREPKWSGR